MLRKSFPAGHPFRVVLHRRDRHAPVLDCLDDFPAAGGNGKALRYPVNRLVMVAVADRFPPVEREEKRTLLNGKGMNHPAAVLHAEPAGQVLIEGSAEEGIDHLQAPADAEDRLGPP